MRKCKQRLRKCSNQEAIAMKRNKRSTKRSLGQRVTRFLFLKHSINLLFLFVLLLEKKKRNEKEVSRFDGVRKRNK